MQPLSHVAYAMHPWSLTHACWTVVTHLSGGFALPAALRHVWQAAEKALPMHTLSAHSVAHGALVEHAQFETSDPIRKS